MNGGGGTIVEGPPKVDLADLTVLKFRDMF